jgi:hypothetical protein
MVAGLPTPCRTTVSRYQLPRTRLPAKAAIQLLGDRDRVAPVGLRPRERELELDRGADLQLPQPLAHVASDPDLG